MKSLREYIAHAETCQDLAAKANDRERNAELAGGNPNIANNLDAVTRYRNRAEELRRFANCAKDPGIRADLEDWAKEYDQMALATAELKRQLFPH